MGQMTLETERKKKAAAPKKKETFSYYDPSAESVVLVGEFTQWEEEAVELKRQRDGTWKATVSLAPGSYEYRFKVDGEWRDDPDCPTRRPNAFGAQNCVRIVSE